MQITLPDDHNVLNQAKAAGFDTVAAYVLDLIEQDAPFVEERNDNGTKDLSAEEWSRDFRAFLASLPSSNPNYDDSRESIYPVR